MSKQKSHLTRLIGVEVDDDEEVSIMCDQETGWFVSSHFNPIPPWYGYRRTFSFFFWRRTFDPDLLRGKNPWFGQAHQLAEAISLCYTWKETFFSDLKPQVDPVRLIDRTSKKRCAGDYLRRADAPTRRIQRGTMSWMLKCFKRKPGGLRGCCTASPDRTWMMIRKRRTRCRMHWSKPGRREKPWGISISLSHGWPGFSLTGARIYCVSAKDGAFFRWRKKPFR